MRQSFLACKSVQLILLACLLFCLGCPPGTVVIVAISPMVSSLSVGETVRLTAISTDNEDTVFTWSTAPEGLVTLTSAGPQAVDAQAVAAGVATITAIGSHSGISGTAQISITQSDNASAEMPIALTILTPGNPAGPRPITVGVPIPASVSHAAQFTVRNASGPVPTQVREAASLGSSQQVRWLLVDFQAQPGQSYRLDEGAAPAPDQPVVVTARDSGGYEVDTGAGKWIIAPTSAILEAATAPDGAARIDGAGWGEASVAAEVTLVEDGPLRAMIRVSAEEAVAGLDLVARLHFYAGLPYARVQLTLVNHQGALTGAEVPAADNGECSVEEFQPIVNGLLSPNSIMLDDVSWSLQLAATVSDQEVIYQDSSGTDHWNYYVGHGPRMQSGVTRRGYVRTVNGLTVDSGDSAGGALAAGGVRLDVPWFRELFPKALRLNAGRLEFGIFPAEFAGSQVLRVGEQKTHDLFVGLDPEVTPPWPVYAAPSFGYLRATHALGYIGPRAEGDFDEYEEYLDAQMDDSLYDREECVNDLPADGCPTSLPDARERWDMYGWTDYGDVPTDFEFPTSPYNLKYDMSLGFLLQGLRLGSFQWWAWAHAANVHFADIDILHARARGYSGRRQWWQGGAFGHSYHDEQGLTNPHRNCCNPANDLYYGMTGLAAWALLTGDDVAREAAIEMADNTLWRIRNTGDTACAVEAWGGGLNEGWAVSDPPSRSVANTQRILVWAYRLTGNTDYLEAAGETAVWYECERSNNIPALTFCASWQEALLGRSMAEYLLLAADAGVAPHAQAAAALRHILESLSERLSSVGGRAWFRTCESYSDTTNQQDEINAWMFLGADVFAYGFALLGERSWLDDYAAPCFTTASRDPWYEGDTSQYHSAKEVANTVPNGLVYLHFAQGGEP